MMEQWKIIYSNQSRVDLLNIDNYIRYDLLSPMAANRITDKFLNMIKNLNSMPKRYPLYPEEPWYSLGLRYFPVENYIVFYYPEDNKQIVQIIRIMYSRQDISGNLPTKLNNQKRASFFDRCSFFAWEQRKLGEVVERFDNLRIPVTSSKRESGITPYYGANGIQDYVQGYTHDGEFVLVAEDGANDLQNYPIHYVNGKVWVNNHAHVLQGNKDIADNLFLVNAI